MFIDTKQNELYSKNLQLQLQNSVGLLRSLVVSVIDPGRFGFCWVAALVSGCCEKIALKKIFICFSVVTF